MFTGIVTDIGTVKAVKLLESGKQFEIFSNYDTNTIDIGASIAHNGVCLTVVSKTDDTYSVEAWEEALRLTNADTWEAGTRINLERSLKVGDEMGGHIVSGHIDGLAKVISVKAEGDASRYTISAPKELAPFIAPKGSVTLNGTSLTVNGVNGCEFDVLLIKHTQEVTTWPQVSEDDQLNLEIDTMARYVARYAARLAEFPSE